MNIQFLYPQGKLKALTFSYDDGQQYDRQLVGVFNYYQVKGTFHLNSGTINNQGFILSKELKELYKGHEIACHGVNHCYLNQLTKEQIINEIWEDRKQLEKWTNSLVQGMSYAFGEYSDDIVRVLECLGIKYARTVESTQGFKVPSDFMRWEPTCHHNEEIDKKAELFLNTPDFMQMPLFYIWGHSFEFARENNWKMIESFLDKVAFHEEIWYATNMEIRNYITAIRNVQMSVDSRIIFNPSHLSVWLKKEDRIIEIKPGESKVI